MESQVSVKKWVTTTSALLAALREPANQTIWLGFDARYRPLLEGFLCRLGLGVDEAAEVAQQTLTEFVRDYRAGKYDPRRGRLSAWMVGIARHRAIDHFRARGRQRGQRGSSALFEVRDEELTRLWEVEREQTIMDRALQELWDNSRFQERSLRVFERTAIHGDGAEVVASTYGLSVDEVYRVKHRVTRRLREIVERVQHEYE